MGCIRFCASVLCSDLDAPTDTNLASVVVMSCCGVCSVHSVCCTPGYVLQHGDAILIEAYESLLRKHKHSAHFSLMREVADSQPPKTSGLMDR